MTPDLYLKLIETGVIEPYDIKIGGSVSIGGGAGAAAYTELDVTPDNDDGGWLDWLTWERFKEELARANPLAYLYVKSAEVGYETGKAAVPIVKAVQKAAKALGIEDPKDFLDLIWYGIVGIGVIFLILKLYPSIVIVKHITSRR